MIFIFALLFIPSSAHAATTIFVAPNGNNETGNGSIDMPYQSIQHAINSSNHGDTISVREGVYYELVKIGNKFTDREQFLTIQPYQNEKVVLDGARRDPKDSKRAAFFIENSNYIKISGFEIRNITTDSDDFFPAGILVRGFGNNIHITDNNIHHIANTHSEGNAHGLLVYGNNPKPIENIVIQNNELHDLTLGSSESLTLTGNITDFLIDHNTLYNNNNIGIDVAGHYNACRENGCIDIARNGTISNNHVTQHSSRDNPAYEGDDSAPGIYVDGGAHIQIINNYVANNNYGISIGSENKSRNTENIIIQNNVIKRNDKAGLVIGGSKSNKNGGASGITVKNNHFFANDTKKGEYYEITLQQNIQDLSLSENSYAMCRYNYHINNTSKPKISFKQNKEKIRFSFASCK